MIMMTRFRIEEIKIDIVNPKNCKRNNKCYNNSFLCLAMSQKEWNLICSISLWNHLET